MDASQAKEILERNRKGSCTAEEAKLIELWYQQQLERRGDFGWLAGEKELYANMIHTELVQKN